ncbi:MAG TPA: sugar ABC transporter substrate-binding protein [Candidatus Mediterraneibacter colneyensis]|nr:sugar ABC transporter substrate-binding protein [Candidatus Mediterraneibacter colneyensis]
MKKFLCVLLSALMCVGLLAGCGSGEESSGDGGSSGKLVYIAQDMNDSFASWLANSVESLGTERGYDVTVMDCQADGAKCVEMLENARNMSPDAIILQPMADAQVLNTIEGIRDDGIELVVVNLPLPEDPDAVPTVVCDDYTLGYEIAQEAAENLPENANIVILNGIPGMSVTTERRRGFQEGLLDARSDVTLLAELDASFNKDEAMDAMDDWLQKFDDIDGVICASDGMALGAIESYKSNNKDYSNVQFYGIDGLAEGCLSIQSGELTATVLQDAQTMADEALNMVEGLLDGSITDNQTVDIDAKIVNSDNVEEIIEMHRENGLIEE